MVALTPNVMKVLKVLWDEHLEDPYGVTTRHGLHAREICRRAELPPGSMFPVMHRLVDAGLVERLWEERNVASQEGRSRRRFHKLTDAGALLAETELAETELAEAGEEDE